MGIRPVEFPWTTPKSSLLSDLSHALRPRDVLLIGPATPAVREAACTQGGANDENYIYKNENETFKRARQGANLVISGFRLSQSLDDTFIELVMVKNP